eukprot:TRINITY_DN7968_c0_g1_i1.p1 TRINITY_DN7968_c0_g1~~TRINITY_DN7968_c0_g1_i1.p1  ORF type:complete len:598 (+),score=94.05 TRINITY_DN7968_c0_g1_i1:266-2059(+)
MQSSHMNLLKIVFIFQIVSLVYAGEKEHTYELHKPITMYANKIGPYDNPDESYAYSDIEVFCHPAEKEEKNQHLGEELEGDSKTVSVYKLNFGDSFSPKKSCTIKLDTEKRNKLKNYIKRNFYYEFVYDDIPIHNFVGKYQNVLDHNGLSVERFFLYTHLKFTVLYHKTSDDAGVVIFANLTRDLENIVTIDDNTNEIEYIYSAKWVEVDTPFSERSSVYKDHFFNSQMLQAELEIHWLSILNSFVLVLLLTGFVALILMRILNRDYVRYNEDQEESEYGWKLVAGDVFRFPSASNLFCSLVGVGTQFVIMSVFLLGLAIIGVYYPGNDGAMYVSGIVLYALTALVAGFVSSYWYKKMEGTHWPWNILLTTTVFALPFLLMAFFVNTVAIVYNVTKALPFTTIMTVLVIWLFVGFPLTLIGGIAGKHLSGPFKAPVRTKNFAREIPYIPWYRRMPVQIAIGGFLPFSAIYIELHYLFNTIWARGFYQLWGILLIVFIILIIVTACTTIALTYFQLSMEDYRWWWSSFFSGGSTGIFILGYSVFYYMYRSKMTGFLQASFYFGYQCFLCYFFFLMLGSVGFFSSYFFVKRIYKNLHTD